MLSVFKRKKKKKSKSEDDPEGSETADVGPEETNAEDETSSSSFNQEDAPTPKPARPKLVNDHFRQGSERHMRSRRSHSQEPSRSRRSSSRDARRKPRDKDNKDVLMAMYGDPNAGCGTEDKEDTTDNIESPTKSKDKEATSDNIESPTKSKEAAIDNTEVKLDPSERANGENGDDHSHLPIDGKDLPSESQDDESASPSRKSRRAVRGDISSEVPQTPRGGRRSNRDGLKVQRSSSRDAGRRRRERTDSSGEVTPPRTRTESKDGQSEVEHRSSENKDGGKEVTTEGLDDDDQSVSQRTGHDAIADVPQTQSMSTRSSSLKTDKNGGADVPETPSRASRSSARRRPSGDVVANADGPETPSRASRDAVRRTRGSSRDPLRRTRSGEGMLTPRSSSRDPTRRTAHTERRGRMGQYHSPIDDQAGSSSSSGRAPRSSSRDARPSRNRSKDAGRTRRGDREGGSVAADQPEKWQEPEKDQVTEEVSTTEPCESLVHELDEGDVMQEKDSIVEKQALGDVDLIDENEHAVELDTAPNEEKQVMKEAKQEAGQTPNEQEDEPGAKSSLRRKLLSPVTEAKPSIMKSKDASESSEAKNPAMNLLDYMDISYQDISSKSERTKSEHRRVPEEDAYKTEPLTSDSTHSLPARPSKHLQTVDDAANTAAKDFAQVDELFQSMGKKKPSRRPDPERKELTPLALERDRGTKDRKVRRTKASEGYDDEKHLPPPSLAGDEYKKTRKVVRAKPIDDHDRSVEPSSRLAPPSIAPMSRPSKSEPKDHDSDGDEERDAFDDAALSKKISRKIQRTPIGESRPALNLAPPSLAGDEQRIDDRKDRKKSSKSKLEGDDKAVVDKRKGLVSDKKAQSFSVLMDADGDDDSVGDIPETSVGVESRPKSVGTVGRGMLTKARSVTNVLKGKKSSSSSSEPRKLKSGKRAISLRNVAV